MKKRCFKGGFTLIELLVVVLIIGILAAIALPQYNKAVEKAHLSEALTTINALEKAMDDWILRNGGIGKGKQYFLGTDKQNELVIDLTGLDCGRFTLGHFRYYACVSKHFEYDVLRTGVNGKYNIYVGADRFLKADKSDISQHYSLEVEIAPTGEHTRRCFYEDELGQHVCQGLTSQGWIAEEGI